MTDKELRRLSRAELLELLLAQSKENEYLQEELDKAKAQLADRTIAIETAGSIAEASLQLNGVFQAAQDACAQYIENIKLMNARQEQICARMEKEARESSEKREQESKKI